MRSIHLNDEKIREDVIEALRLGGVKKQRMIGILLREWRMILRYMTLY